MVKLMCLFIIGTICCSCCYNIVSKNIKQNFAYCYDGKDTGIDSLIYIEGYYDFRYEDCPSCYRRVMFYKDGTYVTGPFYTRGESVQSHFNNIVNRNPKELYYFHKYNEWGHYIIRSDTIKLQSVDRPVWGSMDPTWKFYEVWYKIIDRNTIIGIYPSKKPNRYTVHIEEDNYMRRYGIPAKFTPLTVRPDSNCWLKEKKWFWCNEEDWEEYKTQIKKNKK